MFYNLTMAIVTVNPVATGTPIPSNASAADIKQSQELLTKIVMNYMHTDVKTYGLVSIGGLAAGWLLGGGVFFQVSS